MSDEVKIENQLELEDVPTSKRWVNNVVEKLSYNKLGQFVLRKADNILWFLEETLKWSFAQGGLTVFYKIQ